MKAIHLCTAFLWISVLLDFVESQHHGLRHIIAKNPKPPKDDVYTKLMLWNDTSCRELVGTPFDKIESKNKKRIGPYKADLCRLYVLYKYGGMYTDDDIWLFNEPPKSNMSIIVIRESPTFKGNAKTFFFNAFIAVPAPRHPGILEAIKLSLKTMKYIPSKFSWGPNLWGPWVLHTALKRY